MRKKIFLTMLPLFIIAVVVAQEKPTPEKPQPEPKRTEVSAPTSDVKQPSAIGKNQNAQALPKIDLPEFVITGIASIDLPSVEKEAAEERAENTELDFSSVIGARDRNTVEFLVEEKQGLGNLTNPMFSGRILASMGNYFTPKLGLWVSRLNPEYQYIGDVQYHLTRGYAPYTNSSGGSIGAKGSMALHSSSSLLNNATLSGYAGYNTETYRFYGSSTPSLTRTTSSIAVGASIDASQESPWDYSVTFGVKNFIVADSDPGKTTGNPLSGANVETSEVQYDVGLESRFPLFSTTFIGKAQFSILPYKSDFYTSPANFEISVGNALTWWNNFFLQASVNAYLVNDQYYHKINRIYPRIRIGYRLFKQTTLIAAYNASVIFRTRELFIQQFPYLSVTPGIQNFDIPIDVTGAVETNWTEYLRTRFSYRHQEIDGYNLLTDVASPGIWNFFYGGRTTVATFQTDMFAQMYPNSYFTVTLAVNSTKNSVTQDRVPYKADLELSASYSYSFPFGLRIEPRVNFVDRRNVDVFNSAKLPDYFLLSVRGEYAVAAPLSIALDLHNVLDRKYELWRGYQAPPFTIAFGLTYKW